MSRVEVKSPAKAQFSVEAVIMCDDIRKENSGKYILIGVYDGILVQEFPVDLFVSYFLQCKGIVAGRAPVALKITGPHGVVYREFEVEGTFPENELISLVFNGLYANMQLPGSLELSMKDENGNWTVIKSINVEKADPSEYKLDVKPIPA